MSVCSKMLYDGIKSQRCVLKKVLMARASQGEQSIAYHESTLTMCIAPYLSGNARLMLVHSHQTCSDLFEYAPNIRQCLKKNKAEELKQLLIQIDNFTL